MELNPVFKYLKKDIMTRRAYQMNIDFFGQIQATRVKEPIRLYLNFNDKDLRKLLSILIPSISINAKIFIIGFSKIS